jgi:acyl-CoA thioesterase I
LNFGSTIALSLLTMAMLLACAGQARLVQGTDVPGMLPGDRQVAITYVALGDSTVAGVGASSPETTYVARLFARLREVYPNAQVSNLGIGGANAPDVLGGQVPRVAELQPRLVTLSVGPNDLTQGRSPEQFDGDLDQILSALTADPNRLVVVNLMPDLSLAPVFPAEQRALVAARTAEFNAVLRQKAEAYGAVVVDLYMASQDEIPRTPDFFAADGYHPSDAGYARWAEMMWRTIESRIPSL